MLQFLSPREPVPGTLDQLVVTPHHPDRLRRPPARLAEERRLQALTWNVFRTLELIAPSFWLRRLHVRLTGDACPAPQLLQVRLWQPLPLPPIQRLDGARPDVTVDVLIETEHAAWTLVVAGQRERWLEDDDRAARVIDAAAWETRPRDHFFGVIETDTTSESFGGVFMDRYSRSRDSAELRSFTRGRMAAPLTGYGAVRWTDLAAILRDCSESRSLSMVERALAQQCLGWLASAI
jgi:hypothetical protein